MTETPAADATGYLKSRRSSERAPREPVASLVTHARNGEAGGSIGAQGARPSTNAHPDEHLQPTRPMRDRLQVESYAGGIRAGRPAGRHR
jgi:hypothetical protein